MISECSSVPEPRQRTPPELDRLELKVRRLLEAHDTWRQRAEAAEARIRDLETTIRELGAGRLDPLALADEVRSLDERNRALRERMEKAGEMVQRMLARLQFAQEDR
jgi:chromosome segregation ATPase